MSHVMYDSKRLIPAPLVSLSKRYDRTADQTKVGSTFSLVVRGQVLSYMGSPNKSGVFWDQSGYPPDETVEDSARLQAVLRKIEAIRELFSEDGRSFEIQSANGTQPMKCNPRVVDIQVNEGRWYDIFDYTITLEADIVYINGTALGEDSFSEYIADASESWTFEVDEQAEGLGLPHTYRLSHSVSATGKKFFDETGTLVDEAWIQAQNYVLPRLGFDSVVALSSGVNNLPSTYGGYNHVRTSQQDELAGTYSVTENWILASGSALEEFEVSIKTEQGSGPTQVSINGTITGLEERDSNMQLLTTKYENALSKYNSIDSSIFTRAQNYAGITLNPVSLSKLVGKNEINGVINYSREYDNRPSNIFTGVLSENIRISEVFPADLVAIIPVLGRTAGPVLQYLNSKTERIVSLSIELVVAPASFGSNTTQHIRDALYGGNPRITQPEAFQKIFDAAQPINYYNTSQQFIRQASENWDAKNGRYDYSVEFLFGD